MSYEKEDINNYKNSSLINFKISIGLIVVLGITFFAILIDRTLLFEGFYFALIIFLFLATNSLIGIIVNIIKRKVRKNPYKLLFFHSTLLIVSILALILGYIGTEIMKSIIVQIIELIKEATIELYS